MKFSKEYRLSEIAGMISKPFRGNGDMMVLGLNEIHKVQPGDLTFVDHPKYYDKVLQSQASVIIINRETDCPEGKALIVSDDPFRDFNVLVNLFRPMLKPAGSVQHDAEIGTETLIYPGAYIGHHVKIGSYCIIHPGVVIYDHSVIGNHVTIHANTVIGADAFYYKRRPDGYDKLLSSGRVIIHDHVEIGACCTIDKGVSGDTIIGRGTKLDNQIHVGHDTVIGKNCLFAAQVGIAGVVNIEDDVILWGQVGVQKDLTIGKGAVVLGQSGIPKSLEGNKTYFGSPVRDAREKMKELALIKRLPELIEKIS